MAWREAGDEDRSSYASGVHSAAAHGGRRGKSASTLHADFIL